ncbi:hypothetical protein [Novosphingobium panipatense]|uniref:hypothetical protein n=1 Tax=Novosphingobium panipatense TaxID=428991 RepID=UPI0036155D93
MTPNRLIQFRQELYFLCGALAAEFERIVSRTSEPDYDPFNSEHRAAAGSAITAALKEAGEALPHCRAVSVSNLFENTDHWPAKIHVLGVLRKAAVQCRAESWARAGASTGSG